MSPQGQYDERDIVRRIILYTEQIRINAPVKSIPEVWSEDKKLLESGSDVNIENFGDVPTNPNALAVLDARNEHWRRPRETITLKEGTLNTLVERLTAEVENSWQAKFDERPKIEIVEPRRFLPRMNKLEIEINKQMGYVGLSTSIPQTASYPSEGVILIPSKFVVNIPAIPKYSRIRLNEVKTFNTAQLPWNKNYLQYSLYEVLSIALYRQLRGEWKSDYIAAMKNLGPDFQGFISILGSAINQKRLEVTSHNEHNEWSLYTVSGKILSFWGNSAQMDVYRLIDAVSQTRSIAQTAMIDIGILLPNQDEVAVGIHSNHPNYVDKRRKFLSA